MAMYEVIWQDQDDGTLFDAELDEPGLVQAAIVAVSQVACNMVLVSVQEAGFAREVEDEW
jgi:hypothetical protein